MHRLRSSETARFQNTRKVNNVTNRQSHECCLHNETGGYTVPDITSNSEKNFRVLPGNAVSFNSTLHTGTIQRHSRRAVQSQSPSGMASQQNSFRNDLSKTGSTRHRPICLPNVSSRSSLCKRRLNRSRESIHRCIQQMWQFRPVPAGDPILATSVLGTRSSEACPTTSTEDSEPSVEFNRPANQPSSTRGGQVKFGGMDGTGWLNQIEDWYESEVLLLENSWRTSTLKTYKPVWSRWRQWAISHNIPVDSPKPQSLAKYLCHLFNEIKLAPRTVALHKSVVATFANPNQSLALSSHPLVKQVIKGIFARQPPQKKPLSWKIEDLLNFLKNYTFQEDSIFGVSRHTSLLLLLASGSFRAAIASDIWSSNRYDIDEVLLRGNWRSRNTFLNHYFKEIPKQSRAISNILIESFNPV
ncbi:hypothetical protein ACJJTC_003381 [Scirpophaga incertulas]